LIYSFEGDPKVRSLVATSELPGTVGAVIRILALPGANEDTIKYNRIRTMLNLNCVTQSNASTGWRDSVLFAWYGKDRVSAQGYIDGAEDLAKSKTSNNNMDCPANFLDEVGALVGSDEILAETANILLRQKEADGSDLQKNIVTSSKGSAEALLLELTDPSDELIYDGISVINTVNSGPSDRIMYAMINNSGYAGGDAFLEQAKKVMKQDGKNIKVNETNRNKRMANMMQIVKQADWAVKKAVDSVR